MLFRSVISLELINTAIELLVRGMTQERIPLVGQALDVAAGATLLAAIAAVAVGVDLFGPKLWALCCDTIPLR